MTLELQALLAATAILFISLAVQGGLVAIVQGFGWGFSPRDTPQERSVLQGRADRNVANTLEGLALFAPLVLVAHLVGVSTGLTQLGAGLFVLGRAGFTLTYLLGVSFVRSFCWGVGAIGLIMIAWDLVRVGF